MTMLRRMTLLAALMWMAAFSCVPARRPTMVLFDLISSRSPEFPDHPGAQGAVDVDHARLAVGRVLLKVGEGRHDDGGGVAAARDVEGSAGSAGAGRPADGRH